MTTEIASAAQQAAETQIAVAYVKRAWRAADEFLPADTSEETRALNRALGATQYLISAMTAQTKLAPELIAGMCIAIGRYIGQLPADVQPGACQLIYDNVHLGISETPQILKSQGNA